jgi:hypothetical protein
MGEITIRQRQFRITGIRCSAFWYAKVDRQSCTLWSRDPTVLDWPESPWALRNVKLEIPETAICGALTCQFHIPNNFTFGPSKKAIRPRVSDRTMHCHTWSGQSSGLSFQKTIGAVTTVKWNHREEELIFRFARGDNDLTVRGRPLFERLG